MNLLLINLSLRPKSFQCIFPIGTGYIATALQEAGFNFYLIDMDAHKWTPDKAQKIDWEKYDILMMGCIVTGYKTVKEIARIAREKNKDIFIIIGNSVASSIPEILLSKTEADIAVIGEGDKAVIELLQMPNLKRKMIYKSPNVIKNLDDLPFLNWGLFDMNIYINRNKSNINEPLPISIGYSALNAMPVNSARGCPYKCTFCYQNFCQYPYRYRSIKSISQEIDILKKKYDINYVTFYDDLTLFSKRRAEEFAEMMTGKDVYWQAEARAGLIKKGDEKLVKKLKKANCVSFGYSLESANEKILKTMNKKISLQDFREQKEVLSEGGIATVTSLVIGYPEETEETLKETFDFLYEIGIYPSPGYLQPQPATPMYEYALKHGFIKNEEEYLLQMGDRQDLHLNMTSLPFERLEYLVKEHLKRIRDHLKLPLDDNHLIKTGVMKGST